jgi:hypothetical protein
MTRDLLLEATRALRDVVDAEDGDPRATRARVLSTVRRRGHRSRVRALRVLPLAACLGTLSAWAATQPALPTLWNGAAEMIGIRKPTTVETRATPPVKTPTTPAVGAEPLPAAEPKADTAPEPKMHAAPEPKAHAAPEPAPPPKSHSRRAVSPALDVDPEHELYRAAHHAHFVAQDHAAALSAWDAYLAGAPTGRFAVEARYNRALCLLRLGSTDAARAALAPFAGGTFGDYRRREAEELLRVMADR